ncbi:MAG: hypothetical protein JO111_11215 [Caulobacteraceae bacterium]|nr:hypothetical protein [Caulobacteraceae bacterium]
MKFSAIAAMTAAVAFAGAAAAQELAPQATMQPIPNPPESGASSHHGGHHKAGKHHHASAKSKKSSASTEAAPAAAPASPQ